MLEPPARSPAPPLRRSPSEQSVATISTYKTAFSTQQSIHAETLKDVPIIAVMGPTGAGKSTFVKIATGADHVQIGAALTSCTQKIQVAQCHHSTYNPGVLLIDTPGFDDTTRSDAEILEEIANWLRDTYEAGIKLSGILYLHRITDNRMSNTLLRNLVLFQNLCGSDALSNVTFVTTHWDQLREGDRGGVKNEEQLRNEYWNLFLQAGSQMLRFEHTSASAWNIINSLPMVRVPLRIQREMVDQRKPLADTAAGQSLIGWLANATKALKKFIRQLERLVKEKCSTKDDDTEGANLQKVLNEAKTDLEEVVEQQSRVSGPHRSPSQGTSGRPHKGWKRLKNKLSSRRTNLTSESAGSISPDFRGVPLPLPPLSSSPTSALSGGAPNSTHRLNSPTVIPIPARSQNLPTQLVFIPAPHIVQGQVVLTPAHPPPESVDKSDSIKTSEKLQLRLYDTISEIVRSKESRRSFCKNLTNGEGAQGRAQGVVDYLNAILHNTKILKEKDRSYILRLFCELTKSAEVYPTCYVLGKIEMDVHPTHAGGFADVHKGNCKGQVVCCKVLRLLGKNNPHASVLRTYAKEVVIWSHLSHKNILPFYGIHPYGNQISLISPWMKNGDLRQYLEKFPETPRVPFAQQIVDGLRYLHDLGIVHSDLKAENVLVSDEGRALVADFGVSFIVTSILMSPGQSPMGGTTSWMAPELLSRAAPVKPTKESDIWSFGCICYELFIGKRPFYQYEGPSGAMLALLQGEAPSRPEARDDGVCAEFEEWMWEMMLGCWKKQPQDRYTCKTIQDILSKKGVPDDPAETSNSQIRESLGPLEFAKAQSEVRVNWQLVENILDEYINWRQYGTTLQ